MNHKKSFENLRIVNKLAEEDRDYQLMERDRRIFEKQFVEYADRQPLEIRNFLYGYADLGVMMGSRKLMLACEHMEPVQKEETV